MLKHAAPSLLALSLVLGVASPSLATSTGKGAPAPTSARVELSRKGRSAQKPAAKKKAEEEAARKAAEEEAARKAEEERAREEEARLLAKQAAEEEARRQAEEAEARKRAAEAEQAALEARGLDARARRLSDEIARAIKRLPGDHRDQTFAVVPFAENDEESRSRRLGLVVSDMLITNLARDHRVSLVERSRIGAILEEQAFQMTGAVDPAQAAEVGKLLGARGLVVGEVTDTGDAFRIGARVLDMESASVLAASEATLPKEELIALSADAVVLRSKSGAFFRSVVAPGWGQLYNKDPVKAAIVGGGVGLLALSTVAVTTSALLTHNAYTSFTPSNLPDGVAGTYENVSKTVVGLRESANMQYTAAAILAGVTAAAWLAGALDAYLSGVDVETLDDALARR